jgi:hypothetical protein
VPAHSQAPNAPSSRQTCPPVRPSLHAHACDLPIGPQEVDGGGFTSDAPQATAAATIATRSSVPERTMTQQVWTISRLLDRPKSYGIATENSAWPEHSAAKSRRWRMAILLTGRRRDPWRIRRGCHHSRARAADLEHLGRIFPVVVGKAHVHAE